MANSIVRPPTPANEECNLGPQRAPGAGPNLGTLTTESGRQQIRRLEGALRSKHPAARLGILIKALSPFTNTFDTIIYTALNFCRCSCCIKCGLFIQ